MSLGYKSEGFIQRNRHRSTSQATCELSPTLSKCARLTPSPGHLLCREHDKTIHFKHLESRLVTYTHDIKLSLTFLQRLSHLQKMKFIIALAIAASAILGASATPQGHICTAVCRPTKPVCPPGEAPSGSPACWGCCQPVVSPAPIICTAVCHTEPPVCAKGYAPSGSEGCWGCCQPIVPQDPTTV